MKKVVKMAMSRKALVTSLIARRQLVKLVQRSLSTTPCWKGGYGAGVPGGGERQDLPIKVDIGKREVVGFGMNGEENYIDSLHAPFPAIRFKEETADIVKIKQKEAGDWKKLTLEEKKALYRHSFCQTLTELNEPSGEWKKIGGIVLFFISLGLWGIIWLKMFVYDMPVKTIADEELVKAQIKRMIDMRVNPIQGMASRYDYENNKWKDE